MQESISERARPLWSARVRLPSEQWLAVPAGLEGDAKAEWVSDSSKRILDAAWTGGTSVDAEIISQVVTVAAERRSDEVLLDLLFWPSGVPVVARVLVTAGQTLDVEDAPDLELKESTVFSDTLGIGRQTTHMAPHLPRDAARASVWSRLVFRDGEGVVVVDVEPVPALAFVQMQPDFVQVVDQLQIEREDGSAFRGLPLSPSIHLVDEPWLV